jgi:TRAP-type mannitol/chloroaromatic compound transport system permease large subunit
MQSFFDIDLILQVSGLTPGRAATLPAMVMGLVSLIIGWWALARSSARVDRRRIATILSIVLALISIVLSAVHLGGATGEIGTGSGKLGAIVALVLAFTGLALSGIALTRIRRMAQANNAAR